MAAATVELSESNGAVEVVTDGITAINYGSADIQSGALTPASHPIIIGQCSFFKMVRFHLVTIGTSTQVDTLKVWKSAGTLATGETLLANTAGTYDHTDPGAIAYIQPDNNAGAGPIGAFIFGGWFMGTSAPAGENLWIGGAAAGHLSSPNTYSNYWCSANRSTGSTPAGLAPDARVFTVQYNEV